MSTTRFQVFLASRFGEFADVRRALCERIRAMSDRAVDPIDLNDGIADERPPLERSLAYVRQSDIFLLLVGDTYGERVPGRTLSYTHSEYHAALKAPDKLILAFFIGDPNLNPLEVGPSKTNADLARFQRELCKPRTMVFYPNTDNPITIANKIFESFYKRYSRFWALRCQLEEDDDSSDSEQSGRSPLFAVLRSADLMKSDAWPNGLADRSLIDVLVRPAEVRAAEHASYAARAIVLLRFDDAIHHLRRAREIRPLHLERTYWLAWLLAGTDRPANHRQAVALAHTAAELARDDGKPLERAAALVVAARASMQLGLRDEGLDHAREAYGVADWHWITSFEVACQYAELGRAGDAFPFVEKAFRLRPDTIRLFDREPSFVHLGSEFRKFRDELHAMTRAIVEEILATEDGLMGPLLTDFVGMDVQSRAPAGNASADSVGILDLVAIGRASVKRQLELLQRFGRELQEEAECIHADEPLGLARVTDKATREAAAAQLHGARRTAAWVAGACGAVALAGFLGAWLGGDGALAWRLLLFVVASGLTGVAAKLGDRWRQLGGEVTANERSLADCRAWLRDFDARKRQVLEHVRTFAETVSLFERHVLPQTTFVWRVVRSAQRATVGQLIRLSASDEARQSRLAIERSFLPPELAQIAGMVEEPSNQFRLFRVRTPLDSSRPEVCRWAAYFE